MPAEAGRPKPTRKPAAKSGPTKAQALKALGISREELDLALEAKNYRDQANKLAEEHATEVQKQDAAREAAIATLKNAGLPIPPELQGGSQSAPVNPTQAPPPGQQFTTSSPEYTAPVQAWVEPPVDAQRALEDRPLPPRQEPDLPEAPREQTWFARNARNMLVSLRFTRQEGEGKRRTELKPRGQRGDLVKLETVDLNDPVLRENVALGIIEVITEAEALDVMNKQAYNRSEPVHTPSALLRNEYGKEYEQGTVGNVARDESWVAARLKPVAEGEYGEVQIGRGGIDRDYQPQQPQQYVGAGIGGNPAIVSDGFAQQVPAMGAVDQSAMEADALARSKAFEGPGAGTGRVAVVVEPTRRS